MFPMLLLLLSLQSFGQPTGAVEDLLWDAVDGIIDAIGEYFYDYDSEELDLDEAINSTIDWLFELFDETDMCDPNPCLNNGTCETGIFGPYECTCPRPFIGKKCQDVENVCKNVNCGKGECVRISNEPFYECKCKAPYRPPRCKKPTSEEPDPTMVTTPPPKKDFSVCGKSQPTRPLGKIFGGRKALPGAHPWQASLQIRLKNSTDSFRHFCGGILLDSCWILTAAHCMTRVNETEMLVGLGGVKLEVQEAADQTLELEDYIIHENYTETDSALHNDIALLKLKAVDGQCARETRFVKAACLPTGPIPDGTECTISGYGVTEHDDEGSTELLDAKVLLISQEQCMAPRVYGDVLDDSMFCAGHMQGGVDSCQGDSGGPLVCKQNSTSYIYGVVSWGDACGKKNKPGIYARVTHFLDWINEKMRSL